MSGECDDCGEHALECGCPIIRERKWISKEEAKEMFPFYGKQIEITSEVTCNDGTRFQDYTWEQHLQYLGYGVEKDE